MRKLACSFALLAFCIPVSLSASSKIYKKNFTVTDPVQVQSVRLTPGKYQVTWMKMGSNVPVTIRKDNRDIVTVPAASVVKQKGQYSGALVMTKEPSGTDELTEIEFSKVAIMLPPASPAVR